MGLSPENIDTLIWASVAIIGIIAVNVGYVRSCRWKAIEKQGWPKRSNDLAEQIRALGESSPVYKHTATEPKPNDNT